MKSLLGLILFLGLVLPGFSQQSELPEGNGDESILNSIRGGGFLIGGEYFFDMDPGLGSGTPIPIDPTEEEVTIELIPNLENLDMGPHSLYLRFQDEAGNWGAPTRHVFFLLPYATLKEPEIVAGEVFFDTVKEPGTGTPITFIDDPEGNQTIALPMQNLEFGAHTLLVRYQDSLGNWGPPIRHSFFLMPFATLKIPEIVAGEIFFDTDQGPGTGTSIAITPDPEESQTIPLSLQGLGVGGHSLFVRYQDSLGNWAMPKRHPFMILPRFEVTAVNWSVTEGDEVLAAGQKPIKLLQETSEIVWTTSDLFPQNLDQEHFIETQLVINGDKPWIKIREPFEFHPVPGMMISVNTAENGDTSRMLSIELSNAIDQDVFIEQSFDLDHWESSGSIPAGETILSFEILSGKLFFRARLADSL